MEWIERLNKSMNYIEEHICEELNLAEVAKIACCSTYHFQRMFSYMANIPLSEYVRRRRLSLAAVELMSGQKKVVDVALKYGYDSPTAFNRAFKNLHGITPSEAKETGISVKAFPPISFRISIKGDYEMNYRIEKREAIRIVGVSSPLEKEMDKNFEIVPGMWAKAATTGLMGRLAGMIEEEPKGLLGVSSCNDEEDWRYYIAVATNKEADDLEEFYVPKATWAIFSETGTNISMKELEKQIVTDWLPTSGYEYANAPDMEVFIDPDPQSGRYEVWIPVVQKEK